MVLGHRPKRTRLSRQAGQTPSPDASTDRTTPPEMIPPSADGMNPDARVRGPDRGGRFRRWATRLDRRPRAGSDRPAA